jgi:hypothetical protein
VTERSSFRVELLIFVAAIAIAVLPTIQLLARHDGNVSALLNIGTNSPSSPWVRRDFHPPVLVPGPGHDGQGFYVVARNFPHLQDVDGKTDRLRYRVRRILFPMLVAPFPKGPPTVWAMLGVNLAAIGAAAVGASRLARRIRGPAWLGLAAAVTPALVVSARASLSDALAFSLALWGVVLWRRKLGWAVLLFSLAALTRETTLIAPAACFIVADARRRWRLAIPFAVYAVWVAATDLLLHGHLSPDSSSPLADALRQFDVPFRAWAELGWTSRPVLLGMSVTVASLLSAYVLRHRLPEIALWLVGDTLLVVLASADVAGDTLNYARFAPLVGIGIALAAWEAHASSRSPAARASARAPAT